MGCLKCDGQLQKVVIGEVDKCERCCGSWFDLGELKRILEHQRIDKLRND